MSTVSNFLSHLRHSEEATKNWPSWKTNMWQKKSETQLDKTKKSTPPYSSTLFAGKQKSK